MSRIITLREHIKDSVFEAGRHLARHACPVFMCGDNKRPDLVGSCFFLILDDEIFLITASHVIDCIKKQRSPLYVGVGNIVCRVPQSPIYRTVNSDGNADHIDVAAVPIRSDMENYESIKDIAISIAKSLMGRSFSQAHLTLVQGYPLTKHKPSKSLDRLNLQVKTTLLTTAHALVDDVNFEDFSKDSDTHFALRWEKTKSGNAPPHPRGLSGGPLWIIPNSLEPDTAYLGGVFIEMHGLHSIAFVTKLSCVVDLIDDLHAHL